ncbi:ribosomal protein L7/L12 [Schaalia sp. Marseille-Q2122]|uniref:ribosomal protein L7/L12 n=1 Tax=Schaalia sp. Marseille-Q2122 TaxID=2736604 RepID=UPI00158D543B|nr:ribosomal protein L7/L12 [Schaalia sp. Marseille-Q2122]
MSSDSARVEASLSASPMGGLPADALVDMTLKDAGESPAKVIEVMMAASGMSLIEAKACVDSTPAVVLRAVRADEGRQFAREVSMAGGTTILAPAESAVTSDVAVSDAVPDALADLPDDAVADLVLRAVGAAPVAVVKALFAHCGCDLKGAKDLADQAPVTVMEGASLEVLVPAYRALQEAGAEVEVVAH